MLERKPHRRIGQAYSFAALDGVGKENVWYSPRSGGPAVTINSGLSDRTIIVEPKVNALLSFLYGTQTGYCSESCDLSVAWIPATLSALLSGPVVFSE